MANKRKVTKKRDGLKLEIHLTNRWLYTLIVFFGLALVGVVVYAQTAPNPGHAYSELDLGPLAISQGAVVANSDFEVTGLSTLHGAGSMYGIMTFEDDVNVVGVIRSDSAYHLNGMVVITPNRDLVAGDGTSSAPGIRFLSNTGTGLYSPATNNLGISTAGLERMRINPSGNVGIGIADPQSLLHVAGDLRVDGDIIGGAGGSDLWTQLGDNIYYNQGSVGIGTDSPGSAKLMVDGYTNLGGSDNLVVFIHNGNHAAGAHRGTLFSRSGTFANGRVFCDGTSYGFGLLGQGAYYICNNPRVTAIDGSGGMESNFNNMKLASGNNHHNAFCLGLGFYGPRGAPSIENSNQNRMIWSNSNRRWDGTGSGEVITSLECWIGN